MPAINVASSQWVDIYTQSAIAKGTGLLIQNQGSARMYVQQAAALPAASDNTGRWVEIGEEVQVDAGAAGVYGRCSPGGVVAYVQATA